jgi:putative ABC transport system permease protein
MMTGVWTSQQALAATFSDRVQPTVHLLKVRHDASGDVRVVASQLEAAFLRNGLEADSLEKLLSDLISANLTFNRLIMGFMGLGLIVGVAALGVIAARSVVERRQQIGVLRAIGFRRRMVQAAFLLESSFIALSAIVVGTGLALAVGFNIVNDSRRQPSWEGMSFEVPWLTLGLIFLIVYGVALLTTLVPAARASRVYPAEALRYQ